MDRKFWLGSNWKMTKTTAEGIEFMKQLDLIMDDVHPDIEVFMIPSYTGLYPIRQAIGKSRVLLGSQNMHWEDRGAFTGEISPLMLKEIPVDIVELGHSERRASFNENDLDLNKKIHSAINHHFKALLCIGENIEQKESSRSEEVLAQQLRISLKEVTAEQTKDLIIAYEPVWAIGEKGIPASASYVESIHIIIRSILKDLFNEAGASIPILYGGSVNHDNFMEYAKIADVNGLFIGRAAWEISSFKRILDDVSKLLSN